MLRNIIPLVVMMMAMSCHSFVPSGRVISPLIMETSRAASTSKSNGRDSLFQPSSSRSNIMTRSMSDAADVPEPEKGMLNKVRIDIISID